MSGSCPTRRVATLLAATSVTATSLAAQRTTSSDTLLAGITARGRALYEYDQAAWHGTDAVVALRPDTARMGGGYFVRHALTGWTVSFGRLTAQRDTFLVSYEAETVNPAAPGGQYVARVVDPPRPDTGYLARAARAFVTAAARFRTEPDIPRRPYNNAVLPASDGTWWVYFLPAQLADDVWPLGADVRYRVSADGARLLDRRRMHNTLIEVRRDVPSQGSGGVVERAHTAVVDDVPEDTDVFHVLTRSPKLPELVATDRYFFRIDTTGAIRMVGDRAMPRSP